MRKYTSKGRVVYDRPKHLFGLYDLLRIGEKTGSFIFQLSTEDFEATLVGLLDTVETEESFERFGGGKFGGAGATRSFGEMPVELLRDAERRLPRIVIMVENLGGE